MTLTLSPWWLLLAAVPILWLGEAVVRRVPVLARFNIPVPVVGGLLCALVALLLGASTTTSRCTCFDDRSRQFHCAWL